MVDFVCWTGAYSCTDQYSCDVRFWPRGVTENKVYAHMWGNILNSNGHEDGKKIMEYLLKKGMTQSQVEKATDLARECVRKNYKDCKYK